MKRTTIKDIASKLEISQSTVSRALSNHPDISERLKELVNLTAREMKYRPSLAALHLKRGTNKSIALIIPEVISFFYPSLIHGIEEVMHQQGYTLIILPTNDTLSREKESLEIAYDQDVAGVILALSKETSDLDHLTILQENNTPIILVDKVIPDAGYTCITIDDYKVSYQMVQYLYKIGCRTIAGLFGRSTLSITHYRYKGFLQALKDLGLNTNPSLSAFIENLQDVGPQVSLILNEYHPDGLYIMTDEIMFGVMPTLSKLKIKVPESISLMAISDGKYAPYMIPSVSHMKHDGYEMGSICAQKMIQYINAKKNNLPWKTAEHILMNTNIVLMESTR